MNVAAMSRFARLAWQTLAISLITFGLAEAAVKACRYLFPTALPSFVFYDRSYNRYRGRPGAADYDFRLNSGGYKDVEFVPQAAPGTYRIVALGDSFAFGVVPYEYNYLTLLEQRLNDAGRHTEVLNMGIPGIGPQDYLALLADEGLALQPDLVLVSFFVGNDFTETMRWRTRLHEFSDVLALGKYVIDARTRFSGQVFHAQSSYDDAAPYFSDATFLAVEKERSEIYLKRTSTTRTLEAAVEYLVRIKELCAENGVGLGVIIIPDEVQVDAMLQRRVLAALQAGPGDADFSLPNTFLRERLRSERIDGIDLLSAFASGTVRERLYKPNDTHWNIAGNELAASLLEPYVASLLNSTQPGAALRRRP